MKLQDLFPIIEHNPVIYIFDEMAKVAEDKAIAVYNGRDSIPSIYNDCIVVGITPLPTHLERFYPGEDGLIIDLDHESVLKAEKYKKANERDRIIWWEDFNENEYSGGTRGFTHISVDTAQLLIDRGYLDPEDHQNFSPTAREIINFIRCSTNPYDWWLSGYAVSPARDDFRVTIDSFGIKEGVRLDNEDAVAFVRFARYADEFCFDMEGSKAIVAEAWWD